MSAGANGANFNVDDVAKVVQDGLKVAVKALLELVTLLLMLGGLINSIQETICKIITRIWEFVRKIIAWLFGKKKKQCKSGMCSLPGRGAPQAGNVTGGQSCVVPPKGAKPMMKCGNCFIAGTPVMSGADRWPKLEEVVLGQRVQTWLRGESGYAASLTIPDTVIDPTTWRAFWFVQEHDDGYRVEVGMLRPLSWLAEQEARDVGEWVTLDLPEMGVEGAFQLMAVDACPTVEAGGGRSPPRFSFPSARRSAKLPPYPPATAPTFDRP